MAADVSTIVGMMEARKEELEIKRRGFFTRDLMDDGRRSAAAGICFSMELDLDLEVPSGWERRLDLTSGKTYLHRMHTDLPSDESYDLNLPPSIPSATLPEDSALLDLKLYSGANPGVCQSVCTLEKVESALRRVVGKVRMKEMEDGSFCASASPSSSTASSLTKRGGLTELADGGDDVAGGMMAAACPRCLLYVLIAKGKPRCPRCDSHVPVPFLLKKLKFDLNSSS